MKTMKIFNLMIFKINNQTKQNNIPTRVDLWSKWGQRINLVGKACTVKSNSLPLWHEIRDPITCHPPRCAYRQLRRD